MQSTSRTSPITIVVRTLTGFNGRSNCFKFQTNHVIESPDQSPLATDRSSGGAQCETTSSEEEDQIKTPNANQNRQLATNLPRTEPHSKLNTRCHRPQGIQAFAKEL